jgi:hypothetical protein
MSRCYIYIIAIDGHDLCKVGISKNPQSRLSQLNTGSPYKMRFVCILETPNASEARKLESAFHKVMRKHRTNGEWFSLNAAEAIRAMTWNVSSYFEHHIDLEGVEVVPMMRTIGFPDWAVSEWVGNEGGGVQ